MKLLGHTSPRITMRYVDVTLTDLQREFELARSKPRHLAPQPKTSPAPLRTGLDGLIDSLHGAQQKASAEIHRTSNCVIAQDRRLSEMGKSGNDQQNIQNRPCCRQYLPEGQKPRCSGTRHASDCSCSEVIAPGAPSQHSLVSTHFSVRSPILKVTRLD
jgi:hypothetical protein